MLILYILYIYFYIYKIYLQVYITQIQDICVTRYLILQELCTYSQHLHTHNEQLFNKVFICTCDFLFWIFTFQCIETHMHWFKKVWRSNMYHLNCFLLCSSWDHSSHAHQLPTLLTPAAQGTASFADLFTATPILLPLTNSVPVAVVSRLTAFALKKPC